jgi:hypothetical protein
MLLLRERAALVVLRRPRVVVAVPRRHAIERAAPPCATVRFSSGGGGGGGAGEGGSSSGDGSGSSGGSSSGSGGISSISSSRRGGVGTPPRAGSGPPNLTIDITEAWGHLIRSGVYGSPHEVRGRLVGRHGSTLREVADASGAALQAPGGTESVLLWGPPEALASARVALDERVVPAATIAAESWSGGGRARGVFEGAPRGVMPPYAEVLLARAAEEGGPGVRATLSVDRRRVHVFGPREGAERGRRAILRAYVPAAVIDIRAVWSALLDARAYGSAAEIAAFIVGPGGRFVQHIREASGAWVHVSRDGASVYLYGSAGTVRAAREALDRHVIPTAVISVADAWGRLIGGDVYPTTQSLFGTIFGRQGARTRRVCELAGVRLVVSEDYKAMFLWGTVEGAAHARRLFDRVVNWPWVGKGGDPLLFDDDDDVPAAAAAAAAAAAPGPGAATRGTPPDGGAST